MIPEQAEAVRRASEYFSSFKEEKRTLIFCGTANEIWKRTFAAYQLAKTRAGKILVLTFKLAVESAWEEDLSNMLILKVGSFFQTFRSRL